MQIFCKYATAFTGLFLGCENEKFELSKHKFAQHVTYFGLSYDTIEEYHLRFNEWKMKDEEMNEINASQKSFQLGHNHFSTWTQDEYKQYIGNEKWMHQPLQEKISTSITLLDESNPQEEIDWRTQGAVNPVKNQGECKSDWAFSAIAATEGHYAIQFNDLLSFSEQQLMDCAKFAGHGCDGGSIPSAIYSGIKQGFMLEKDYPYLEKYGDCLYDKDKVKVMVKKMNLVQPQSVTQLQRAVSSGPVAGTVDGTQTIFQMYKSGILDDPTCGTQGTQGIVIVGYGSENGKEFFIVRNSWSDKWGEDGYIRIAAVGGQGICGIQVATYWPETSKPVDTI